MSFSCWGWTHPNRRSKWELGMMREINCCISESVYTLIALRIHNLENVERISVVQIEWDVVQGWKRFRVLARIPQHGSFWESEFDILVLPRWWVKRRVVSKYKTISAAQPQSNPHIAKRSIGHGIAHIGHHHGNRILHHLKRSRANLQMMNKSQRHFHHFKDEISLVPDGLPFR